MSEPYIKLHMWMAVDLGLSGNELIVFAVIHGYTASCGGYQGGMDMLGKWCGLSRRNAYRALSPLIEKGLVKQTISSKGRNAAMYVSLVNRVNTTQLDAQLTVSNRDGKPCQNDTHIDNINNINNTPYSPPKGDSANADATSEHKPRTRKRRNRALEYEQGHKLTRDDLKALGISLGEEIYEGFEELRIE